MGGQLSGLSGNRKRRRFDLSWMVRTCPSPPAVTNARFRPRDGGLSNPPSCVMVQGYDLAPVRPGVPFIPAMSRWSLSSRNHLVGSVLDSNQTLMSLAFGLS